MALLIATFVISLTPALALTVTSPNGGENWGVGSVHSIAWSGGIQPFDIDYSTNSGSTWMVVARDVSSSPYQWTIPNTPSANCQVRVTGWLGTNDMSDGDFAISTITVLSPNGGESLCVDSTYNIRWNSNFFVDNVKLEYTTTSGGTCTGGTWLTIINSTENDGIYQWTIPNTPSTNCKVRVSDAFDGDPCDVSDAAFTIGSSVITVTRPNGGEQLCVDSLYSITWNSRCFTGNMKIEYSTNGGLHWNTIIASTPNNGNYQWTVPNTPSANCLVLICDATDSDPCDTSNAVFTIATATITVTAPNGGEHWRGGYQRYITWSSDCFTGNVKIHYSINSGGSFDSLIVASCPNTGQYLWTVPCSTSSDSCRVQVCDATDCVPADVSNNDFTITYCIPLIPVLTNYGIIVLLILLMGTAVWMIKKRRLAMQR